MSLIDLNSDLGEGFDDDALLDIVSSASIACGFHAGGPGFMRRVCERAAERGVTIGAHVGYRDLAGFGRRAISIEPGRLSDEVLYQIGALDAFARAAGDRVRYVKPHGAMYNMAAIDPGQAWAVIDAMRRYDPTLAMLCPPGSELWSQAEQAGLTTVAEAFADRAYTADGRLFPRREPGAVLHDADLVTARSVAIATTGSVLADDGRVLAVAARSICVRGGTSAAVELAYRIKIALSEAGVRIGGFARECGARSGAGVPR